VFTSAALWIIVALMNRYGKLCFEGFTKYRNWFSVLLVSPLLLLVFASQVLTAYLMLGQSGIDLLLHGKLIDISANTAGLIFAAGAPLSVLFLFILPAVILDKQGPLVATINGLKMMFKAPKSMLTILVINALVLFLAPTTFGLSTILFGPFLLCLHFVAYESLKQNFMTQKQFMQNKQNAGDAPQ
jgi:hypothetical protein